MARTIDRFDFQDGERLVLNVTLSEEVEKSKRMRNKITNKSFAESATNVLWSLRSRRSQVCLSQPT